jgi:dolichyl-phosphate beta-glucosyltransferase
MSDPNVQPVLSLIIPVFNFESGLKANIEAALRQLIQVHLDFELFLIDDGSTDGTYRQMQDLAERHASIRLIHYPDNHGKGYAVKQGIQVAQGQFVFFTDVDLPYGVEPILAGLGIMREGAVDLVLGSRDLAESHDILSYDLKRKIAKKGFNLVVNSLLGLGIKDTQCGLKGFRREVAVDIFNQVTRDDFSFDVEVLFLAKRKNYEIRLLPVHLRHSEVSTVSVLRDSVRMFASVLTIVNNNLHKKYDFKKNDRRNSGC